MEEESQPDEVKESTLTLDDVAQTTPQSEDITESIQSEDTTEDNEYDEVNKFITKYKLNFNKKIIHVNGQIKFYPTNFLDKNNIQHCGVDDKFLNCATINNDVVNQDGSDYEQSWAIVSIQSDLLLKTQKMYFTDILENGQDLLVTKNEEGIKFYKYKNNEISLLYEDINFHDVDWGESGNLIKFGHFIKNSNQLGIFTKHNEYGITFYVVDKDKLPYENQGEDDNDDSPIGQLNTNTNIFDNCFTNNTQLLVTPLENNGQDNIIIQTKDGLKVFCFNNDDNKFEKMFNIACCNRVTDQTDDRLFFNNLTGSKYYDIVHFNTTGLFLYQYNVNFESYRFLNYHPLFSTYKGWLQKFTDTVLFQDINQDGRKDMLFTGQQGISIISYNIYKDKWESLLDNTEINFNQRHGLLVNVYEKYKNSSVFIKNGNNLQLANIVEFNKPIIDDVQPVQNETVIEDTKKLPLIMPLPTLKDTILLKDQLDYSFIIEAVDKTAGKPKFTLPLVDLPYLPIKLKIDYNGETSGLLGAGWSLPENLIMLQHQNSIFIEDNKYYLVFQNMLQELILDSENSSDSVKSFKLDKQYEKEQEKSNMQIQYYRDEEQWIVSINDFKQIFGKTKFDKSEPVQRESTWKYWRGEGSSTEDRIEIPVAWYLSAVIDNNGNALYYIYDLLETKSTGNKPTRNDVYLKEIKDGDGNVITLKYGKVGINKEGVTDFYLLGYTVNTSNYEQEVDFTYTIKNNKPLLTAIVQKNDTPALQFAYNDEYFLEKVTFPTGSSLEFTYQSIGGKPTSDNGETTDIGQRVMVNKNYKIRHGSDFIMISYINSNDKVEINIYDKNMNTQLYSPNSKSSDRKLPLLGAEEKINVYDILESSNFIGVILWYEEMAELYLFPLYEGKLHVQEKKFKFSGKTLIRYGKNFVIVADVNISPILIEWNDKNKDFIKTILHEEKSLTEKASIAATNTMFTIYDNKVLELWYKDQWSKWQHKIIKEIPDLINNMEDTIMKFELEENVKSQLFQGSRNNVLQINKNLVLLSTWGFQVDKFYSKINIFLLNDNHDIVLEKEETIDQDSLEEFYVDLKQPDGNSFKCGYVLEDNKFKIKVLNFEGPIKDNIEQEQEKLRKEIENSGVPSSKKEQWLQELENKIKKTYENVQKEFLKALGNKHLLLNLQNYFALLSPPVVVCKNKKFTFTGKEWNVEDIEIKKTQFPIKLGNRFLLDQENDEASIKLYRQNTEGEKDGDHLVDTNLKDLNKILIKYPLYLAYQEDSKVAQIIEFTNNEEIKEKYTLSNQEKLSQWSGYHGIISEMDFGWGNLIQFVYRSLTTINRLLPKSAIVQSVLSFDNGLQRKTGYEYNITSAKPLDWSVFFEESIIIPGNDKKSFGWIKETINQNGTTKVIYNGENEIVQTGEQQFSNKDEEDSNNDTIQRNTTQFDKINKLPVAKFFPYELADGAVSYYGFEDYEINTIGPISDTNKNKWQFNENNIIKNNFTFTGHNYLHLKSGESTLKGTFCPQDQNLTYVVSTWVRPHFPMMPNTSVTPYLKTIVASEDDSAALEYLSEIKLRSNGWYYLESIVNLFFAKLVIDQAKKDKNTQSAEETEGKQSKLKIYALLHPETDSAMDVDHVRFSPLNCRFQANIYDPLTKNIVQKLQPNGLVERFVYDKYGEKIATSNEFGQLTEFSTYTKFSSIGAKKYPKSNIYVQTDSGFYEEFSPDSLYKNWNIDEPDNFYISPEKLKHNSEEVHSVQLKNDKSIPTNSYGIRIYYSLSNNSCLEFNNKLQLLNENNETNVHYLTNKEQTNSAGELLILVENNRLFLWIDGGLYIDNGNSSFQLIDDDILLNIDMKGDITISDVMVFYNLKLTVIYFNGLGEKIQELNLEDENHVIVTGYLYDEIGRQSITTKTIKIDRQITEEILAYYPELIINIDPYSENSIWKTGHLEGRKIGNSELCKYDFSQTKYNNSPLDEKLTEGLPGEEFSLSGPFAKRYDTKTDQVFIKDLYPAEKGYRYRTEYKPGDVKEILVFDSKDNMVAKYVHVANSNDIFSTYEYDNTNKLLKQIPPMYHEKVGTLYKLEPQQNTATDEELILQKTMGTFMSYDKNGQLTMKTTADTGKMENVYDNNGLLRFTVYYKFEDENSVENVLYFNYDEFLRLTGTGEVLSPPPVTQLLNTIHNNTRQYQEFYYNDGDLDAVRRGRIKRSITYNNEEPFIEESQISFDEKTTNKRITIPLEVNKPLTIDIHKRYVGGKLSEFGYPIEVQNQQLTLKYIHDKLGKITSIGLPNDSLPFFKFTYNAAGQIISETHYPQSDHNFTRIYNYNSAGFLMSIHDKYLTENISYTEPGYGGYGYGDGTITRTEFTASWHNYTNQIERISLHKGSFINEDITPAESETCFNKLKESEYINNLNHQNKVFYPKLNVNFPIVCSYGITGRYIASVLGKQGFPKRYGHVYDYGNHLEMTKAKYFIGDELVKPLQQKSFQAIVSNETLSQQIWDALVTSRYIVQDNTKVDPSTSQAKSRKSLIRSTLAEDLRKLNPDYRQHLLSLSRLLIHNFANRQSLSMEDFQNIFTQWNVNNKLSDDEKKAATDIYNMLIQENYFENPIAEEFQNTLGDFKSIIPEMVKVLVEHFSKELGEAEYDVESYSIDANGNHRRYYTGFDRYEINYQNNTNRIEGVKYKSFASSKPHENFVMQHDSRGNVVQALHKGIKKIHYDSVLNRATKMELTDGNSLIFFYDAQGERVLKRTVSKEGNILREIHYIRDESGRCLVEREITFMSPGVPPDVLVTAYIYGARGLIGFVRRDEFYSVISDHEHSVRLVVKDGEVMAAYDYLPYGNLMREFASNPEAHVRYRYTGQEWDHETGLYNFHARFYDPNIGRFYQIDPKGQYFSPYKYAGNSPISLIDPDGEFAILITALVLGLVGAYLGGAAANRTFKFWEWKWRSGYTWLGIVGGFIGGATIPFGFSASVSAFTALLGVESAAAGIGITTVLGIGVSYLSVASANESLDPRKWKFSPETLNAAFTGFGIGSGMAGGIQSARTFFMSLSTAGKVFYGGLAIGSGAGLFYLHGSAVNWDYSNPAFWYGIVDAITSAPDLPMFLRSTSRFIAKNSRILLNRTKKIYISGQSTNIFRPKTAATLKLLSSPVILGLSTYLITSATNNDFTNWDMTSPDTYLSIINGILTGGHLQSTGKSFLKVFKNLRKQHFGSKVLNLCRRAATITNEEYKHVIDLIYIKLKYKDISTLPEEILERYGYVLNKKKYLYEKEGEVLESLKRGEIPNAAIAVGISDDYIVTAYSTSDAPGMIVYFTHNKLRNPTIIHKEFLPDNAVISDAPVALSDNKRRHETLKNTIEAAQDGIKENNLDVFNENTNKIKANLDQIEGLSEESKTNVINSIRREIEANGYFKNTKKVLAGYLLNDVNEIIKFKTKPLSQKSFQILEKFKKDHGFKNIGEVKKSDLYKKSEEKLTVDKLEEVKKDIVNRYTESKEKAVEGMWEQLTEYESKLAFWDPTNCAEPHVFTGYSRRQMVIEGGKNTFNDISGDINFLSTYNIRKNMMEFERCGKCKITTEHIQNIMTDPEWMSVIEGKTLKKILEDNLKPTLANWYFLRPYYLILNKTISIKDDQPVSRTKRRYSRKTNEHKYSFIDKLNQEDKEIPILDIAYSAAPKNQPFFNYIFGWIMEKCGSFLDGNNINEKIIEIPDISEENNFYKSQTPLLNTVENINLQSTLLLANMFFAKKNNTTLYTIKNSNYNEATYLESLADALNIVEEFEEQLNMTAKKYGLLTAEEETLDIDIIQVQNCIMQKIASNQLHEIANILNYHVKDVLQEKETADNYFPITDKYKHFANDMNEIINKLVNKSIKQILERGTKDLNTTIDKTARPDDINSNRYTQNYKPYIDILVDKSIQKMDKMAVEYSY